MRLSRIDEVSKVVSVIEGGLREEEEEEEQGNAINETVSTEVALCRSARLLKLMTRHFPDDAASKKVTSETRSFRPLMKRMPIDGSQSQTLRSIKEVLSIRNVLTHVPRGEQYAGRRVVAGVPHVALPRFS